jgi:hypothetical protein
LLTRCQVDDLVIAAARRAVAGLVLGLLAEPFNGIGTADKLDPTHKASFQPGFLGVAKRLVGEPQAPAKLA